MQAGMEQGALVSAMLFSLYVNDMLHPPTRRVSAVFGRHTRNSHNHVSLFILSRQVPRETYNSRLEHWLPVSKITIDVLNSTAVLFAKTRDMIKDLGQSSFSDSPYLVGARQADKNKGGLKIG
jgi:hypothetical protein